MLTWFSGLISGRKKYIELAQKHNFYLPDYAMVELQEYQTVIQEKTRQTDTELSAFTLTFFRHVTVLPNSIISIGSYRTAFELCKDIDRDDLAYVALAIQFDFTLLTRHKPLAEGLRAKGFTNVLTLAELLLDKDPE